MARRVFLHIGLPKTGTTFLQTTMWANRPLLAAQGLLYPGQQRLDHYVALRDVRRNRTGGAWDSMRAELAAWPGTGLVSHEFFSQLRPFNIARVVAELAPAEVHVVVTARTYVRQFPAVWQEALKMHVDSGFDEFMRDALDGSLTGAWGWETQDLPAVLQRWATVVPVERIHVVTVPPSGAAPDLLWRRWCEVLEIDDSGFDLDVSYPNESLGAQQAALMRRVKPHLSGDLLDGTVKHRWVRRYFGHEVLVPQRGDRFTPRPDHAGHLLERSALAVTEVERAGYQVTGDLADLVDPGPATSSVHPDDVTAEEMLEVAAAAIEQMIRDMRDMTAQRDAWRDRARQRSGRGPAGLRSLARRLTERARR